ncbi:hypothetical protein [Muricoccus aerilatus]|uniref:hypothetical protein n=1 Tax=Muricoccus aerilatus TaxID=452982 RepID=UPI0012EB5ED4|nr:hypothetical protein [Roseomonas aerilata]
MEAALWLGSMREGKVRVTQTQRADRLQAIRLKMAIGRRLDEQGVTSPAAIGAALNLPAAEAVGLLS